MAIKAMPTRIGGDSTWLHGDCSSSNPANGPGLLAIALMVAVAMLLGLVLSGDQPEHRSTAMLLTALRNPGLALLLANRAGEPIHGVNLAILLYALLTALISQTAVRR